jgi:hypothetical protein
MRMGFMRHVTHKGKMRNAYKILVRKHEKTDHLADLGVHKRIILKLIERNIAWSGFIWLKIETNTGLS